MKKLKKTKGRNLKLLIPVILMLFLLGAIILVSSNGISNLMGNSTVANYYCNDSSYTLKDNKCYKNIIATPLLLGDIYTDGIINANDRMVLSRYLAGWYEIDNDQLLAADINKDGKVNKDDLTELNYFITKKSNTNRNIGQDKICPNGYILNNDICEKMDIVNALKD